MKRIEITVTFKGETRTVEATQNETTGVAYVPGFVAAIGAGSARYPATAPAAQNADGSWTLGQTVIVRNRTARLVGWADKTAATNAVNQLRK
jgi:hypothetical protein